MVNNLDTPSYEVQINFRVLQIGTENSVTGLLVDANILRKCISYVGVDMICKDRL